MTRDIATPPNSRLNLISPQHEFDFRTTQNFEHIADRLAEHCGIRPQLASKRLHEIKKAWGRGGADNVVFDFSGGVYDPFSGDLLGSLTAGGAREKA